MDDFDKQKIVWTPVNSVYRFANIPPGYCFNNSVFMIVGADLDYLCSVLNSKLYQKYFEITLSNGRYSYGSASFFKTIPIFPKKIVPCNTLKDMHFLMQNIEKLDNQTKMDQVIYRIYDIDAEEQEYIEGGSPEITHSSV